MKSVFMILGLVLATTIQGTHALDLNKDCGANLSEVQKIVEEKFPQLGTTYIRYYHGTWVYSGQEPMVITPGRKFRVMGYDIVICPRADKKFDVYWVDGKTKAGILGMSGRNQVTVYQTKMGNIALDREGTQTAGN